MKEEEYLKNRLKDQINWYDSKSQWHQKWYKYLKYVELLLGFMIPILSAWEPPHFSIISAICASGMLLCESAISLSKHRDN